MAASPLEPEMEEQRLLGQRIGHSWKELRRGAAMSVLRDHLFGAGPDALEPGQVDTLDLLLQQLQGWRMSDLADALRVDPSTATRAVQRLLREGLAARAASPDDGRVVVVTATTLGCQRHHAIAERRRAAMATMLAAFDDDERRRLADLLERLVGALDDFATHLTDGPPRSTR